MNTAGADKNLFRLVPVLGRSARVLPLELVPVPGTVPKLVLWHQQKAVFRLVLSCAGRKSARGAYGCYTTILIIKWLTSEISVITSHSPEVAPAGSVSDALRFVSINLVALLKMWLFHRSVLAPVFETVFD